MGNFVEFNDTLQITTEQGFPADVLNLGEVNDTEAAFQRVKDVLFSFSGKKRARVYHLDPIWIRLVHNIDGKWLFWGHAVIQSQEISKQIGPDGKWTGLWVTSGTYRIVRVFSKQEQEIVTRLESPEGAGYFFDDCT